MHAIGVDVGGTFTDFVAVHDDGRMSVVKHLTTPSDPSIGVLEGIVRLAEEAGADPAATSRLIHGTTLVANSLIERRGAKTALLTTEGFRDVLEIGRESRYDLYDLNLERPEPLIPRPLRFGVGERVRADGTVLEPIDEAELEALAGRLRELGVESVAVSFLHAYGNSAHERQARAVISREAPEIDVTLSSEVSPEWREYERTSTAAANAFVRPLVKRYLERLERGFEQLGIRDRLYILLSQGGMTSAQVAAELAIQLVESGPAGGVMAATYFGRRIGLEELISFDMGGTTTKVSLVEGGVPHHVPELEVARVARFKRGSGLPLKIPAIELVEIGAGGGSIGRVDALRLLKVGPQSAGADPGPACYGRGGEHATVTDADLALGLLNPDYFLGGEMALRPDLASAALARLGDQIGLDEVGCARGIFEIVSDQMALAMQTHVVERGQDPRNFALVAFGGAGPVHAFEIARRLRIGRIVCPPSAGVASALGFLVSPFAIDLVRTALFRLGAVDWELVDHCYGEMEAQARDLLARSRADVDGVLFERTVDMRYGGQGYTVPVPIPPGRLSADLDVPLREAFDMAYARRFGSHLTTAPVDALHWRLSAKVPLPDITIAESELAAGDARKGEREAYFPSESASVLTPVFDRYRLPVGARIPGPALIEERESTIVVGPSGTVETDPLGNLLISLEL